MNLILLPADCADTVTLTDRALVQHLGSVLRAAVGQTLKVGKLGGRIGQARIAALTADAVTLTDIACLTAPPPKLNLTVVLALPRPKVLRRLVLDMTAMGVQTLYLVNSYRSEKSYWQSPLVCQIDDYVREGMQQACDTVPMAVHLRTRLKPFVEDELPALLAGKQGLIAHPYAAATLHEQLPTAEPMILAIGAEGGWIDYEVALFAAQGFMPVSLGTRILRTENAVSVLCGQFLLHSHPSAAGLMAQNHR